MIGTRRTVLLPAVLLLLVATGVARAEVRVGVVDSQRIVFESEAGKLARSRVDALRNRLLGGVAVQKEALEKARKEYFTRAASLSPEQKEEQKRRIETMERDVQRALEDAQIRIRREGKQIEEELQKKVVSFLEQYGRERGYALILDRLQCLYNAGDTDITEDVLRAFNAAHPVS